MTVGVVVVWLVARAFSPQGADRVAGDLAKAAGTVVTRGITGVADVLTAWFVENLTGDAPVPAGGPGGGDSGGNKGPLGTGNGGPTRSTQNAEKGRG